MGKVGTYGKSWRLATIDALPQLAPRRKVGSYIGANLAPMRELPPTRVFKKTWHVELLLGRNQFWNRYYKLSFTLLVHWWGGCSWSWWSSGWPGSVRTASRSGPRHVWNKMKIPSQRPILNFAPRGKLWPPRAKLSTRREICPLGVKLSHGGEILSALPTVESVHPLGVNEGVNIPPRGQSSPLGANHAVKKRSQWPFLRLLHLPL
jgi:hypothetical protein